MALANQKITDQSLVQLATKGSQKAYNLLLERYHQKIRQIICAYTHDSSSANDLAQEVLIKVFEHLHEFKQDSAFSTWLYRITQNTIKNHMRAVHIRTDSEARFAQEQKTSSANSPEYELIGLELGELLDLAVSQLSEELRDCYASYVVEGNTYEDIATQMHCPIGTVRSRIFRARKLVHEFINTHAY